MDNQFQDNQPMQNPPIENLQPSPLKPDKKLIAVAIVIAVLALAAIGAGAYYWWHTSNYNGQQACTMEAKLCPDGSAVGRTGPNCEFAACPGGQQSAKCTENFDCRLSYTGNDECAPCDLSNQDYKCVSVAQAEQIQKERNNKYGTIQCAPCPNEINFECACNTEICEKIEKTDTSDFVPSDLPAETLVKEGIEGWQTYRNEEIGLEFKYPAQSKIIVTQRDSLNSPYYVFKGKEIIVDIDSTPFGFAAYTTDYDSNDLFFPFKEYNSIISTCHNPLVYDATGNVCKIINIAGEKAVWQNFFLPRYEGLAMVQTRILFENKMPSIYKRLLFVLDYREIKDILDGVQDEFLEAKALEYSKNIIERKNLPDETLKNLELFDQILSTLKFIETQSYTACGCGCCGGVEPNTECLYHAKGDDMQKIIDADKLAAKSADCALMGCSKGIKYSYCD